jgi:hypothetical protein
MFLVVESIFISIIWVSTFLLKRNFEHKFDLQPVSKKG